MHEIAIRQGWPTILLSHILRERKKASAFADAVSRPHYGIMYAQGEMGSILKCYLRKLLGRVVLVRG